MRLVFKNYFFSHLLRYAFTIFLHTDLQIVDKMKIKRSGFYNFIGAAIIQEGPLLVQVQNLVSGLGHLLGVLGAFRFYNLVLGVSWASGAQSDLKIWSWAPFGHLLGVLGAFRFDNLVLGTFWASWAQSDLTTCSWTPLGRLWCIQI